MLVLSCRGHRQEKGIFPPHERPRPICRSMLASSSQNPQVNEEGGVATTTLKLELTPLVGVEDLWLSPHQQSHLQGLAQEFRVKRCPWSFPTE